VGSLLKELSRCAFPIQSAAIHRCDKREGESIGRWYRRYFGISRRDERVHTFVSINASRSVRTPFAQHIAIRLIEKLVNNARDAR
jgi:hypothetical protein